MSKYRKSDHVCKNFIVLVDQYRPEHLKRSTAGRYRVGAMTAKQAEALVRKEVRFGSVKVYYECEPEDHSVGYGGVIREV